MMHYIDTTNSACICNKLQCSKTDIFGGKLSWDITTTQVNSALHPSGVAKSSTSFGWGKGGKVTSAGWQVTLCDLIWHVISRSGVVISITNCYIRFTFYFYLCNVYPRIICEYGYGYGCKISHPWQAWKVANDVLGLDVLYCIVYVSYANADVRIKV